MNVNSVVVVVLEAVVVVYVNGYHREYTCVYYNI